MRRRQTLLLAVDDVELALEDKYLSLEIGEDVGLLIH